MRGKKHNPFQLKNFTGVDSDDIERLKSRGIKTADQMLTAAQTGRQRAALAKDTGIPADRILELVKLSDLARLPGVKGIRARLYYNAGVDSVETMAEWEPEALRTRVTRYMERTGFEGIPPLPKEVCSTIANARKLPKLVKR